MKSTYTVGHGWVGVFGLNVKKLVVWTFVVVVIAALGFMCAKAMGPQ